MATVFSRRTLNIRLDCGALDARPAPDGHLATWPSGQIQTTIHAVISFPCAGDDVIVVVLVRPARHAVRTSILRHFASARMDAVETRLGSVDGQILQLRAEMQTLGTALRGEIATLGSGLRAEIKKRRAS